MRHFILPFLCICLLNSCKNNNGNNQPSFSSVNKSEILIDEWLIITGENFSQDIDYTASIGGINAETRRIFETEIEVKVPADVVDGNLIISADGVTQNLGTMQVVRCFIADNLREAVYEYSLVEGRRLREIINIPGITISDLEYSNDSKELLILFKEDNRHFLRVHTETLEFVRHELTDVEYPYFVKDGDNNIYAHKGDELYNVNLVNGAVTNSHAVMNCSTGDLVYIPGLNKFRGFYEFSDGGGYSFNKHCGWNISTGEPTSDDEQEHYYQNVCGGNESNMYAYVTGIGIVSVDKNNSVTDYEFSNNDFPAYPDYYHNGKKLVIVSQVDQGGIDPFNLFVIDHSTNTTESFQIEPSRYVIITQ